MPEKLHFEGALLDETAYLIPESTKLTISPVIANDLTHILSAPVETLMVYMPVNGTEAGEKGLVAMERLITALRQPEGSVRLINLAAVPELSLQLITRFPNISRIILLGVDMQQLGVQMEMILYKQFNFNKLTIVAADSLEEIEDADKKILWGRLQQMYGLK